MSNTVLAGVVLILTALSGASFWSLSPSIYKGKMGSPVTVFSVNGFALAYSDPFTKDQITKAKQCSCFNVILVLSVIRYLIPCLCFSTLLRF